MDNKNTDSASKTSVSKTSVSKTSVTKNSETRNSITKITETNNSVTKNSSTKNIETNSSNLKNTGVKSYNTSITSKTESTNLPEDTTLNPLSPDLLNLIQYNYLSIVEELKDKKCVSNDDCFNLGECDTKKNLCIFKDIYCTTNDCYQDNKCNKTFVKYPKSQYLRECERYPEKIFETCNHESSIDDCMTRQCMANNFCLSQNCSSGRCELNITNPIYYCSNANSNSFGCKLFLNEPCTNDNECYSNRCDASKASNNMVCLEPKDSIINIVTGVITYFVVTMSLLSIYFFYRHTKHTDHDRDLQK